MTSAVRQLPASFEAVALPQRRPYHGPPLPFKSMQVVSEPAGCQSDSVLGTL